MDNVQYDVLIIGGGPAGLTAAIYTSRERLNTLVLEQAQCGGLAATTELVENYPGFPDGISGAELMDKFKAQAQRFGTTILEFKAVQKLKAAGKRLRVYTEDGEYTALAVIVASGSIPKKLGVPGEEELRGKGVSYCATCDGPLFRDKDVAVIGCGNSGLQEGEALLKYVNSVTFIEFLPQMTAARILQEKLQQNKQAAFLLNHALTSINGKEVVDSLSVKDRATSRTKEIKVCGVFIYAGFLPNTRFLKGMVAQDQQGYIRTNEEMQTNVGGIYAVGDVRSKRVRQIDVGASEGTIAALSVRDYLNERA